MDGRTDALTDALSENMPPAMPNGGGGIKMRTCLYYSKILCVLSVTPSFDALVASWQHGHNNHSPFMPALCSMLYGSLSVPRVLCPLHKRTVHKRGLEVKLPLRMKIFSGHV